MKDIKLLILNLPNRSDRRIIRDAAGGYGIAPIHNKFRYKSGGVPYVNPFLPYSAAVANELGCDYKVFDAQVQNFSSEEIISEVKKYDPDIIFTMLSLPSLQNDKRILTMIKEEVKNALIVCSGTVCHTMAAEILDCKNIDLITRDLFPYVNGLELLLNHYQLDNNYERLSGFSYKKDNNVVNVNDVKHKKDFIDYLPIYEDLQLGKYSKYIDSKGGRSIILPILGSRGCSHFCTYCPYPLGFGNTVVYKDPVKVIDEIEFLNGKGYLSFLFRNQSFTASQKWADEVCNEIIQRKLDIEWSCEVRIDETSKPTLEKMWKSGCRRLHYGVETGAPSLMGLAKPGLFLQKINDIFKLAHELGFYRHAHMILGLPGENEDTLKTTERFLIKLKPDNISINFLTPYPGTTLYKMAIANNWLLTKNWNYYTSFDVVMSQPSLNAIKLYDSAISIQNNYYSASRKKIFNDGLTPSNLKKIIVNYLQYVLLNMKHGKRVNEYKKYGEKTNSIKRETKPDGSI